MTKIEAFEAAIIDWVEAKERLHLATVGYEAAHVERDDAVTAYAVALGLVDGARAALWSECEALDREGKRARLKPEPAPLGSPRRHPQCPSCEDVVRRYKVGLNRIECVWCGWAQRRPRNHDGQS